MEDTDSIPWDFLGEPYRQIYELRQELGRIRAQNAMLREELAKLAAKPCIVCDLIGEKTKALADSCR